MIIKTGIPAAATAALLLCTSSALAVDAQAFADRLKAVASTQSVEMSFDSAEEDGDDVVLRGVRFSPASAEDGDKIDAITFENVTGSTAEGWTVERVPIADIDETEEGTHSTVTGIVIEGLHLVGTEATDTPIAMTSADFFFDRAAVESVNVEKDGRKVFSLSGAEMENEIADDGTLTSEFDSGTFDADFTAANDDAESAATMRDLGYATLGGNIAGTATWNPTTGLLELDPFDIDLTDAGSLSFTYAISGYTPAFIESLKQIQQQMEANPDNQSAAGMAMMGLVSQLFLNSADLVFVDDSLTDKLLDYYAEKNGETREQLIGRLTGMLPGMLSYLQNPTFQEEVIAAVTTFLNDPQSLSIAIAPNAPVPATQLIGAAMGAPQTLPGVLALSVSANDATDN
ncbi:hypothetical protein GTW51_09565 [Aurantimonas aggregata]|uniref:DUF945 family protein n=1 Tax=Aurantimonas aggregata TaxID=2047720 RepID=A0A6L9MHI6_9HYPH|nr:hypothetical protein [Aurantimonas aggregata]NDV86950.1 hypothetical protein [Aurantimonas aggregata]